MKLDDTTITVLSTATEIRGIHVTIVQQLDRKVYSAVNKVLEACGGKWSRTAKAHVFAADPTPAIERALLTGEVTTAADLDFFPTPARLAEALVGPSGADVRAGDRVLEPSAGTGNLVAPCLARGAHVTVVERNPAMRAALARTFGDKVDVLDHDDFLAVDPEGVTFDRVVMNPNFTRIGKGDGIDAVRHAARMLRPGGGTLVSVLGAGVSFRADRRHAAFRGWLADVGGTIAPLPDGSFKASGTDVRTVQVRLVAR